MPEVSVIVPCYNQGQFVDEAVDSVLAQTYQDYDIIIINDGSTDEETNEILRTYNRPQTRVIHTTNQGLASARNNGIRESSSKYILPLDADDKIGSTYLEKAVDVLNRSENAGIVYCEAEFFGDKTGRWELPEYQFPQILLGNRIFCSSFFRKADWEKTSGYRPLNGWEDYDYWLSLIELGREVYRIPEVLFYYRQRAGSMLESMTREQHIYGYSQLFHRHSKLYAENIDTIFKYILELHDESNEAKYSAALLKEEVASMQRSRFLEAAESVPQSEEFD